MKNTPIRCPPAAPGAVALAVGILLAALVATPPAQALATYDLTDLNAFGAAGTTGSIAYGINNAGDIVGNLYDASGQESGGWYLLNGASQWTSLPSGPGSIAPVRAVAINNSRQILGANLRLYPDAYGPYFTPEDVHTLMWRLAPDGSVQQTSRLLGVATDWQPLALNDSGTALVRGTVLTPNGATTAVDRVGTAGTLRLWQSQGLPTTMPLAINNANEWVGGLATDVLVDADYGIRYTALNNNGLRIGLRFTAPFQAAAPVITWREPDGSLVLGSPGYVDRTADLNTLITAGQGSMVFVTGINDLGQIVGKSASGHAALLTLAGAVELVAEAKPFGPPVLAWDTPLGRLPNWKTSGLVDFVIAPTDPAASFVTNGPFPGSPLDDLNNARIRGLTVGKLGMPAGPGSVFNTVNLRSINLQLGTGALTVGENALLQLDNSSIEAVAGGVVNRGSLTLSATTLRGDLANHGGTVSVADGATATVLGQVLNDLPVGALLSGGQVLWVNAGATLTVTGDVRNSTNLQVLQGARLNAHGFTQTAGQLVVNGELETFGGDVVITGGGLYGSGVINAVQLTVGTNGPHSGANPFVAPGNSPGHLTVNGAFELGADATLELQVERAVDGSLGWDRLSATSMRFLDGSTVHFVVGSGVAGAQWQTLGFLDCGSGCVFGSDVHFVVEGAPGATLQFGSSGLSLGVAPMQAAVPEPATVALWLAGLLAVGWRCAGGCGDRAGAASRPAGAITPPGR